MVKEELQQYLDIIPVADTKYWYQGGIKLPFGLETPSSYTGSNCNEIFELADISKIDFKNKSVLDLGCNTGYFAMKAAELGAIDVTAIDSCKEWLNAGKLFAKLKDLNVNFIHDNILNFNWSKRQYDIIFSMRVLYHIEHPIETLLNISKCCKETFIAYTTMCSRSDYNKGVYKNRFIPTFEEFKFTLGLLGFNNFVFDSLNKDYVNKCIYSTIDERYKTQISEYYIMTKSEK